MPKTNQKLLILMDQKIEDIIKRFKEDQIDFEQAKVELQDAISKPDIKGTSVPNICFSLTDADDSRENKYSAQRIERGFDDSETWCLTSTICKFALPRLKRFKECAIFIPMDLTKEQWNDGGKMKAIDESN